MIINKRDIISRPFFCGNRRRSPYIRMNRIKSNGEDETEILRLKGKAENFASLHPLNLKCHKFSNFLKLLWIPKISNEKTKHDLDGNAINKN